MRRPKILPPVNDGKILTEVFKYYGRGATTAITDSGRSQFRSFLFQDMNEGYDDPCTAATKWMTEANASAIYVHSCRIELHQACINYTYYTEGLVYFEIFDVS